MPASRSATSKAHRSTPLGLSRGNTRPSGAFCQDWKANTMTGTDKLIEELIRKLRGRPILEIVRVARKLDNRGSDLYLHKALRKYAADRRVEPSRHVGAAVRWRLPPCGASASSRAP